MDSTHEEFLRKLKSNGATIDGLKPAKLGDKGIGVVATRKISVWQLVYVNQNAFNAYRSGRRGIGTYTD